MNHSTLLKYLFCISSITCLAACQNIPIDSVETGKITFHFDNRAGDQDLKLSTDYTNTRGETFTISKLKYYITRVEKLLQSQNSNIISAISRSRHWWEANLLSHPTRVIFLLMKLIKPRRQ
jgi:hypothetical protein